MKWKKNITVKNSGSGTVCIQCSLILAENNSTHTHWYIASQKKLLIGKENENNETKRPKWEEKNRRRLRPQPHRHEAYAWDCLGLGVNATFYAIAVTAVTYYCSILILTTQHINNTYASVSLACICVFAYFCCVAWHLLIRPGITHSITQC